MSHFQREGHHTVTPRIIVAKPQDLVEFVKNVFRGEGTFQAGRPSEIRIGDSLIMISDGGGLRQDMPAFLYVYVESVDDTFRRAVQAGAQSLEAPADMPYGDRRAMVEDPWGNLWQIAECRSTM